MVEGLVLQWLTAMVLGTAVGGAILSKLTDPPKRPPRFRSARMYLAIGKWQEFIRDVNSHMTTRELWEKWIKRGGIPPRPKTKTNKRETRSSLLVDERKFYRKDYDYGRHFLRGDLKIDTAVNCRCAISLVDRPRKKVALFIDGPKAGEFMEGIMSDSRPLVFPVKDKSDADFWANDAAPSMMQSYSQITYQPLKTLRVPGNEVDVVIMSCGQESEIKKAVEGGMVRMLDQKVHQEVDYYRGELDSVRREYTFTIGVIGDEAAERVRQLFQF